MVLSIFSCAYISFGEMFIKTLCLFLKLVCLFIVEYKRSFTHSGEAPYQICDLQIFLPVCGLCFHLVIILLTTPYPWKLQVFNPVQGYINRSDSPSLLKLEHLYLQPSLFFFFFSAGSLIIHSHFTVCLLPQKQVVLVNLPPLILGFLQKM